MRDTISSMALARASGRAASSQVMAQPSRVQQSQRPLQNKRKIRVQDRRYEILSSSPAQRAIQNRHCAFPICVVRFYVNKRQRLLAGSETVRALYHLHRDHFRASKIQQTLNDNTESGNFILPRNLTAVPPRLESRERERTVDNRFLNIIFFRVHITTISPTVVGLPKRKEAPVGTTFLSMVLAV